MIRTRRGFPGAKPLAGTSPMFTVAEVANMLNVSTRTVRRWIDAKELDVHRLGHVIRISPADYHAFLERGR